ncbi:MAG: DUF4962 domain-containing protein [Verrucomicrobia bacterium]|nr:DUF4962 domain-containing protein [Verrucomicrobiota bacterium]MCF7707388.1 DUF4962 domain-containing protein [Verrucomicrobiota bacterium]
MPLRAATLDESPAAEREWGYDPPDAEVLAVNPPRFTWRYQDGLVWNVQCAADEDFTDIVYNKERIRLNVHCPAEVFEPGRYWWRYRGRTEDGEHTSWSVGRALVIPEDVAKMPMPSREDLLARVPEEHPRLFLRPGNVPKLQRLAKGLLKEDYESLVTQCESILADPPPTEEPPMYPEGMERGSDEWRSIWWGNRRYTIEVLDSAATLGFTYLLDGRREFGMEAKRLLLECAKWEPKGSTGYRYNDEAGMPYNYYFSRTYTFVNALLSEEEKETCRDVMRIRGREMYNHLWPRHLSSPYSSHSNRAWHFLGEIAIAFHDEIDEADDWLWFAMNVFYNMYPVWSDDSGGWHEGSSYWASYQWRFTWWADIMREVLGINAYNKPYYSEVGYYAMYLMPPGKEGGGFGDLCACKSSSDYRKIMSVFAAQAGNPHWQWWVERHGGPVNTGGYIGFIRGALPEVAAERPDGLPTSRLFNGTGQAYLNSQILDADRSVQVVFKSSPFGTQSHGYEANNSLLLWGYGKRLLIRSGYRDSYGSAHHRNWMWSSRSVNTITVNGKGQKSHSAQAKGKIISFKTTPQIDLVAGEAAGAYEEPLERFTRTIIFVKPGLVVVWDILDAPDPSTFEYRLHSVNKMDIKDRNRITVKNGDVLCDIEFLTPQKLEFSQTDQYDPNPRPRINLREWHLTARPTGKHEHMQFVTLYRVHRETDSIPEDAELVSKDGGLILKVALDDGEVTMLLPNASGAALEDSGLSADGEPAVRLERSDGSIFTLEQD